MQFSNILDVATGLIFAFLLLAIVASTIQEFLAGIFRWRGTYLAKAIDVILSNNETAAFDWKSLGDWLHAHFTPGRAEAPRMLSQALPNPAAPANQKLMQVIDNLRVHPFINNAPSRLPAYIASANFASAMLSSLRDGSALPAFTQIQSTIAALPDGDLKKTLDTLLVDAEGSLDRFRVGVEKWFDSAMDRLEGIYKRVSQYSLLILGGFLAVTLNVNALHLARALWDEDPDTRAALFVAATRNVATPINLQQTVQNSLASLNNASLPIGWAHSPNWHILLGHPIWGHIAVDFAGWSLTMVCVSLGAPFWFDIVQRVVNLRSAGQKPPNET